MREIAASSDFDFVAVEPRRSSRGGATKRGKGRKKAGRKAPAWLAALWRYRTPVLGGAALFALLGAIAVNAMFLQRQRHPAPLFGATFKIDPPQPPPRPDRIDALLSDKLPRGALSKVGPAPDSALTPPASAAAPASAQAADAPAAPVARPAPAKRSRDVIGALIAGNGVPPAPAPSKTVILAQRALQRLGLVVKPDGEFGEATRKALEIFQQDNHLPVNGQLTPKTRHMLAVRSGLTIE